MKGITMKFLLSLAAALAVFLPVASHADESTPATAPTPLSSALAAAQASVTPPEPDLFGAGQWRLSPFASYRAHELTKFDGKFGGGLALSYAPAQNVAIELETLSEAVDDSHWADAFTEAGVNFKGYLPLGATGLAPYGFLGYTRNLQIDENRMNAGAGIAWRTGKHFELFADGRWTHNFTTIGHALFRVGGGWGF
jgi:hypothetical protein